MKSLQAIGVLLVLSQWCLAWDRLSGCKLLPNESNDGDSFHVEHEGKEYIFRLYFVDTPESSRQVEERVAAQAEDFGVSEEQVLDTGHAAAEDGFPTRYINHIIIIDSQWQYNSVHYILHRQA